MPNSMTYSEWNKHKAEILNSEIESTSHYLEQQASIRLQALPMADKDEIERRFKVIIQRLITDYKEKITDYYH